MHVAQIVAITASLVGLIVGLIYYLQVKSGDASYLSSSTWTISIPDESVTQTWYLDTDADVLKIVQHKEGQAAFAVQEIHSGKIYEYTMWDKVASTVTASVCDGSDMTETDCDSFVAKYQAILDRSNVKGDCTVEELTGDPPSLVAVEIEDTVVIAGFTVKFTEGLPSHILDGDDGSVVATIDSIVDGIAGDVTFDGCIVDEEEEISERRLGWLQDLQDFFDDLKGLIDGDVGWQEFASNTDWCGAGTDMCDTPCPEVRTRGTLGANMACRRHDHGGRTEPVGPAVRLECGVDRDLADYTKPGAPGDNWAAQAVFGYGGIARVWGCFNLESKRECGFEWYPLRDCGWRGCSGGPKWECSNVEKWKTKYGGDRYEEINHRGSDMYTQTRCKVCNSDNGFF